MERDISEKKEKSDRPDTPASSMETNELVAEQASAKSGMNDTINSGDDPRSPEEEIGDLSLIQSASAVLDTEGNRDDKFEDQILNVGEENDDSEQRDAVNCWLNSNPVGPQRKQRREDSETADQSPQKIPKINPLFDLLTTTEILEAVALERSFGIADMDSCINGLPEELKGKPHIFYPYEMVNECFATTSRAGQDCGEPHRDQRDYSDKKETEKETEVQPNIAVRSHERSGQSNALDDAEELDRLIEAAKLQMSILNRSGFTCKQVTFKKSVKLVEPIRSEEEKDTDDEDMLSVERAYGDKADEKTFQDEGGASSSFSKSEDCEFTASSVAIGNTEDDGSVESDVEEDEGGSEMESKISIEEITNFIDWRNNMSPVLKELQKRARRKRMRLLPRDSTDDEEAGASSFNTSHASQEMTAESSHPLVEPLNFPAEDAKCIPLHVSIEEFKDIYTDPLNIISVEDLLMSTAIHLPAEEAEVSEDVLGTCENAADEPKALLDAPIEPQALLDAPIEPQALLDAPIEPQALLDAPIEPQALLDAPIEPEALLDAPIEPQALLDAPIEPQTTLEAPIEPLALLDAPIEPQALLDAPIEPQALLDAPIEPQVALEALIAPQAPQEAHIEQQAPLEVEIRDPHNRAIDLELGRRMTCEELCDFLMEHLRQHMLGNHGHEEENPDNDEEQEETDEEQEETDEEQEETDEEQEETDEEHEETDEENNMDF